MMWTELTFGCLRDDVLGQCETRRHAKLVDTGEIHFEKIRHEESGTSVRTKQAISRNVHRFE